MRSEEISARARAAEQALGWPALPAPPLAFEHLLLEADDDVAKYWHGNDLDAVRHLAATLDSVIASPAFKSASHDFQIAVRNRDGVAHNHVGVFGQRPDHIETALKIFEETLALTPRESDYHARIETNLANTLLQRYYHTSSEEDLNAAYQYAEQALEDAGGFMQILAIRNLIGILRAQHRADGDIRHLDDAVRYAEGIRGDAGPYSVDLDASLADVLSARYDATGSLADLERTRDLLEAELRIPGLRSRAFVEGTLGTVYRRLFLRSKSKEELDRAVSLLSAYAETSNPAHLTNLGSALLTRFEAFGDVSDLKMAVDMQRAAVKHTLPGDWQAASRHNNAGNALAQLAEATGNEALRSEAIDEYRQALAVTPSNAAERASREYNLGRELASSASPQSVDVVNQTRQYLNAAVEHGMDTSLEWALGAGMVLARWESARSAWPQAASAYSKALEAVNRLFRIQLLRDQKEAWLSDSQGLPSEAAVAMVRSGDVAGAILALESGRGLLLSESLDRDRIELDRLREQGREYLVDAYRSAADALAHAQDAAVDTNQHLRLREKLEQAVIAIRAVEGYAGFLRQPTFDELRESVPESIAAVFLAASDYGGIALIVARGDLGPPLVVDLPRCTGAAVRARFLAISEARVSGNPSSGAFRGTLDAVTRWCWDAVVGPVLEATDMKRLVFVASGLLTMLPLHAAWTSRNQPTGLERRYVLDDRVVSYSPTLRGLAQAARSHDERARLSLLAVADPLPTMLPHIPAAESETAWAATRITNATVLRQDAATVDGVTTGLPNANVLHFACHGMSRPMDPLNSALILANDQPLTLRAIISSPRSQRGVRLAVLSSCDTDQPGMALPDEVVSLPVGFLQAGVAGVVAAQWAIWSYATALLVTRFYIAWQDEGSGPAEALAIAQRWLRGTTNSEKTRFLQEALNARAAEQQPAYAASQRDLVRMLQLRDPNASEEADPGVWAALTYHGV